MKVYTTQKGTQVHCKKLGFANVYIIRNDNMAFMIDTGISAKSQLLEDNISKENLNIEYIILTHAHYDHCGNAAMMKKLSGAKIIAHENSVPILRQGYSDAPRGTNIFSKLLVSFYDKIFNKLPKWHPTDPDITFRKEYDIQEAEINLKVIHTPGHSNDSISIIVDNEVSFVGDTMFGIHNNTAMPPFANDIDLLFRSWEKLLETNISIFFPGHGKPIRKDILEKTYSKKIKR